jgi:hypothetical protein
MKREKCIYFIIAAITILLATIAVIEYTLHRNEVWVSLADDLVFPAACTILGAITVALVGAATASQVLNSRGRTGGGTEARSASLKSCTYRTIVILTISATAIVVLAYIQYRDQSWVGIAKNLLFPLSYTVIGAVIVTWVGISIADEFLDHYNNRVKEGLANRKLFFKGNVRMIESIRGDLTYSGLINSENYMSNTTGITGSDLVILCIKKNYEEQRVPIRRTIADQPKADNTDSGSTVADPEAANGETDPCAAMQSMFMARMEDTDEYKKWKDEAHASVEDIMSKVGHDSRRPALIVHTDGWLAPKTKELIEARPFSALVNTRGRIVSDIHSLLTTLPPRS